MYVKYPRTPHVPWSPGATSDDKIMTANDMKDFIKNEIVITIKMDGECTTVYPNGYTHARSIDSNNHPSRNWLKGFSASWSWTIPENIRVCGENLYAKHSIEYDILPSYFMVFGMFEGTKALAWNRVLEILDNISDNSGTTVHTVREVWRGVPRSVKDLENILARLRLKYPDDEGFVLRTHGSFDIADFSKNVCKWVRENHVQTDEHWMVGEVISNSLGNA